MADAHGEKGEAAAPPARSALVLGGSRVVADLVRYLASDSAGMVTGALLTIDGGLSI